MARISLYRSSSVQLAVLFTGLIILSVYLFIQEVHMIGPGSDVSFLGLLLVVVVLLLIAAGLFFISYHVTKRINRILHTTQTIIETGDLSARIPVDNSWDDLSTLSILINKMLEKIEESVHATRHISDNIAHDLRTPLTRLRNKVETLQLKPCNGEEYAGQMQSVISECDHILSTFQALLRISRIENQKETGNFTSLNLNVLMADITELYEPVSAEKNITLQYEVPSDIFIQGTADLLFQCFSNITDNAIKYTPEGGSITIRARQEKNTVILEISDSGQGIPDAQKEAVFRRFFRVDTMRCTPGNGLGLSLVQAILTLHQATIGLHDNTPKGLIVRMKFPVKP